MSESSPKLIIHSLEAHRLGDGLDAGLGSGVLRSLSKRAVVLSRAQDTVIVDESPDPEWLKFLSDIGIDSGSVFVAKGAGDTLVQRIETDHDLMTQLKNQDWMIEPYMGGDEIQGLTTKLKSDLHAPQTLLLERLNLKSNLLPILNEAGLPTIPTAVVSRDEVVRAATNMLQNQGPIMVRADLSIGGHGVWKIEHESDLEVLIQGCQRSGPSRLFILQPLLDVINSPNVQYEITEAGCRFLGISTQQMTESFAFGGNEFPSPLSDDLRLLEQADCAAQWLHAAGYRGIVGIDFIVTDTDGVFIVEINPRVNTSTFPLLLCQRLGAKAFRLMTSIQTHGIQSFAQLSSVLGAELMFDSVRGSGCVPLMIPADDRPLLDVMVFAEDLQTVNQLCNQLTSLDLAGVAQ